MGNYFQEILRRFRLSFSVQIFLNFTAPAVSIIYIFWHKRDEENDELFCMERREEDEIRATFKG